MRRDLLALLLAQALVVLPIPILPQESPADRALDSNFSIAFNHPRASATPTPIPREILAV